MCGTDRRSGQSSEQGKGQPISLRTRYSLVPLIIGIGLLVHSQTWSAFWDESFHLNAARLVSNGKLPYADFFYQHTPLFAYVCAAWMRVLGDSWRSIHAMSALMSTACASLVFAYTLTIRPDAKNRYLAASVAAALVGLNTLVVRFGTIGQPYSLCLLLAVISFLFTIRSTYGRQGANAFLSGSFAGFAASASLLTLPVGPIELIWLMLFVVDGQSRRSIALRFLGGFGVALIPVALLFANAPRASAFDVIQYHAFYRAWPGHASAQTWRTLTSWLGSPQALLLMLVAATGTWFLRNRALWSERRRRELILCSWLVVGLSLFLAIPYPTFSQYFVLVVPFLAILCAAALLAVSGSLSAVPSRRLLPGLALTALYVIGLATSIRKVPVFYERMYWPHLAEVADALNLVTPADARVYADDGNVYFAARRIPSPGLENSVAVDVNVSPSLAKVVQVANGAQIDSRIRAGAYASVVICLRQDEIGSLALARLYSRRMDFASSGCSLFWR